MTVRDVERQDTCNSQADEQGRISKHIRHGMGVLAVTGGLAVLAIPGLFPGAGDRSKSDRVSRVEAHKKALALFCEQHDTPPEHCKLD